MYKTKSFSEIDGSALQYKLTTWISTEKHITIVSINTWSDNDKNYGFIVYRENGYEL